MDLMKLINRCPHTVIRGIYGDEINHSAGYRLACSNCGRLLKGPVSLRTWSIEEEYLKLYREFN
jgi:hypothetical protein